MAFADPAELREQLRAPSRTHRQPATSSISARFTTRAIQDETAFLVMGYLEDETLARRLRTKFAGDFAGAIEIADALDKARIARASPRDLKRKQRSGCPRGHFSRSVSCNTKWQQAGKRLRAGLPPA
jgi:hypothetical protein